MAGNGWASDGLGPNTIPFLQTWRCTIWYYIYVRLRSDEWRFITCDTGDLDWLWWDVDDLRDADLFARDEMAKICKKLLDDERIKEICVIDRGEPVLN